MFRMSPIIIGLLFLPACTVRVGPPQVPPESNAIENTTDEAKESPEVDASGDTSGHRNEANEPPAERETHNVAYRGIVQPAGISIYMQGSHRLVLPDGRFVLLESESLDLNGYVGEEVEIFGSTRPTVEANGIIMRVDQAKIILPPQQEESTQSSQTTPDETIKSNEEPEVTEEPEKAPAESPEPAERNQPTPNEAKEANVANEASLVIIEAMAAEDFSIENWTQEYCSSHIGFCIPIHRNWWYKSFGTTTSTLWHVEVGNSPVLNLRDGAISINLLPGDLSFETQANTEVRINGDTVVASRPWSGNRHVEIRSHTELEAAVRYMIDHISSYEGN